jgi:Protein of unknown function (DUF669)
MAFTYTTAKTEQEERDHIELGKFYATIDKQSVVPTSNGDPMVNVRWSFADGDANEGKTIYDRLVFVPTNIRRIESFCKAIGRDPAKEFGDSDLSNLSVVAEWAETLLGEVATLGVGMGKASSKDGVDYPARPEVKSYSTYGNATTASSLLADLDS